MPDLHASRQSLPLLQRHFQVKVKLCRLLTMRHFVCQALLGSKKGGFIVPWSFRTETLRVAQIVRTQLTTVHHTALRILLLFQGRSVFKLLPWQRVPQGQQSQTRVCRVPVASHENVQRATIRQLTGLRPEFLIFPSAVTKPEETLHALEECKNICVSHNKNMLRRGVRHSSHSHLFAALRAETCVYRECQSSLQCLHVIRIYGEGGGIFFPAANFGSMYGISLFLLA